MLKVCKDKQLMRKNKVGLFLGLALENGVGFHVLLYRDNGRAHQDFSLLADIANYAALGADCGVVCDLEVTGNAYLACQDAVFANLGGACNAALGSHCGMVPYYHVVGYLAEIVNFDSVADNGGFHLGLVHGGVGAYFYVVANDNVPKVLNLFPTAVRLRRVAKAIGPNHNPAVQDYVVADYHAWIDAHTGIEDAAAANGAVLAYIHVLVDYGIVPHNRVTAHIGVVSKVNLLAEFGGEEPAGPEAAVALGLLLFVGHILQEIRYGRIGIVYADKRGSHLLLGLEVLAYNEDGGGACVHEGLVFGVGEKAKGARLAMFNLGKLCGLCVFVAFYGALKELCQEFCG